MKKNKLIENVKNSFCMHWVYVIGIIIFAIGVSILNNFYIIKIHHNIIELIVKLWSPVVIIISGLIVFFWRRISIYTKCLPFYKKLNIISVIIVVLAFFVICTPYLNIIHKNETIEIALISVLLILVYIFHYSSYKSRFKKKLVPQIDFDDSITNPKEDKLDRRGLAYNIVYGKILKLEPNKTLRIYIDGEWGDGKTSVLNLIEYYCDDYNKNQNDKLVTVWYNPWIHRNKKDVWTGLRIAIENRLLSDGYIRLSNSLYSLFYNILKSIFPYIFKRQISRNIIGSMINEITERDYSSNILDLKNKFEKLLEHITSKRTKIIVLIDDLDRLDNPEEILEVLLGIKELMNVKNIVFILGLDANKVAKIVCDKLYGFKKKYIDKRWKIVFK